MGIFVHIKVVIVVDEFMPDRLAENKPHCQNQKTANQECHTAVLRSRFKRAGEVVQSAVRPAERFPPADLAADFFVSP